MKRSQASQTAPADDHAARVHPFAQTTFINGMVHALHGVVHVFKHERNARIHLMFALAAFLLGVLLEVSDAELAAVFFAIIIVFLAEIFNTAIERILDLIDPNENQAVKLIKDMSAGAVFLAAVAALIVGVAVFAPSVVRLLWRA